MVRYLLDVVLLMMVAEYTSCLPTPRSYVTHPDPISGQLTAAWQPESKMNPEEMGRYFEGDILLDDGSDLLDPYNAMNDTDYLWPGGVVPYIIHKDFTDEQRARIDEAVAQFNEKTCIRFVNRTDEADYVSILNLELGCFSMVGRRGGMQVVNLQDSCLSTLGTPVHEFLHALGFYHQQSSTDRDDYVTIFFENINPGQVHNFNKENTQDFGVSYDYDSVMHYSTHAFSSNGQPTIGVKQPGAEIGQRRGFSDKDIQKLHALYQCA